MLIEVGSSRKLEPTQDAGEAVPEIYDHTESVGEICSRHGLTFQPVTNERRANYISALI
jgi:hypothetical protein